MSIQLARRSARVESDVARFPPFAKLDLAHAPPTKVEGKPRENVAERDARMCCFAARDVDAGRLRHLYDSLLQPAVPTLISHPEPTRAPLLVSLDPQGTLRAALDAALAARDARELWTLCEHAQLAYDRRIVHVDTEYTSWWLSSSPMREGGVAEVLDRSRADAAPLDLDGASGAARKKRRSAAAAVATVKEEEEEPSAMAKRKRRASAAARLDVDTPPAVEAPPAAAVPPRSGGKQAEAAQQPARARAATPTETAAAPQRDAARVAEPTVAVSSKAERKREEEMAAKALALAEAHTARLREEFSQAADAEISLKRGTSRHERADAKLTRKLKESEQARDPEAEAAAHHHAPLLRHLSHAAWRRARELGAELPAWASFLRADVPAVEEQGAATSLARGPSLMAELEAEIEHFADKFRTPRLSLRALETGGMGSALCEAAAALCALLAAEQLPADERRELIAVVVKLAVPLKYEMSVLHDIDFPGSIDSRNRSRDRGTDVGAAQLVRAMRGCCLALKCCVFCGEMKWLGKAHAGAAASLTRIARNAGAARWAMGSAAYALEEISCVFTSYWRCMDLMDQYYEPTSKRGDQSSWSFDDHPESVVGHALAALCVLFTDEDAPLVERVAAAEAAGMHLPRHLLSDDIRERVLDGGDLIEESELDDLDFVLTRWEHARGDAEELARELDLARKAFRARGTSAAKSAALPPIELCKAASSLLFRLDTARRVLSREHDDE